MIFKQRTRKIVDRATELQYTQTHKIDGSQFQTVRKEHEKTVQTLMKKLHARKKIVQVKIRFARFELKI